MTALYPRHLSLSLQQHPPAPTYLVTVCNCYKGTLPRYTRYVNMELINSSDLCSPSRFYVYKSYKSLNCLLKRYIHLYYTQPSLPTNSASNSAARLVRSATKVIFTSSHTPRTHIKSLHQNHATTSKHVQTRPNHTILQLSSSLATTNSPLPSAKVARGGREPLATIQHGATLYKLGES
ncbi:hypothetical protein K504DRAFT_157693 [Pleomassaria siparia CBS 279.74]|uniref:Uncharacterized protein n=1 Tax=Pleomassaria siparia CBS 279.74 TaxID=1314801 RepID=A0A6G1KN96_9PLEO|nr:hypothetical protein K504DRAFT_157693 [Pleomassaria siparia CBS 279.74]